MVTDGDTSDPTVFAELCPRIPKGSGNAMGDRAYCSEENCDLAVLVGRDPYFEPKKSYQSNGMSAWAEMVRLWKEHSGRFYNALDGAIAIATYHADGRTYAAVASDDYGGGIQLLDITDPANIVPKGSIIDDDNLEVYAAKGIAVYHADGRTYAVVMSWHYPNLGVQLLDITDPANIVPKGSSIIDDDRLALDGANSITTYHADGRTYAAVASYGGIQLLDITDPANIVPKGSIIDDDNLEVYAAKGIAVYHADGRTYAVVAAVVASGYDDGVQLLDITDPDNIVPKGSIIDDDRLALDGANSITTYHADGRTYAAVASEYDDGVQLLDITDPDNIVPKGSITVPKGSITIFDDAFEPEGVRDIAIYEDDGRTYAAVPALSGNGIRLLDITDPDNIVPKGSITDDYRLALGGARDIAIYRAGNYTYAAVAAWSDDGVQIIYLGPADDPSPLILPEPAGRIPVEEDSESTSATLESTMNNSEDGSTVAVKSNDVASWLAFSTEAEIVSEMEIAVWEIEDRHITNWFWSKMSVHEIMSLGKLELSRYNGTLHVSAHTYKSSGIQSTVDGKTFYDLRFGLYCNGPVMVESISTNVDTSNTAIVYNQSSDENTPHNYLLWHRVPQYGQQVRTDYEHLSHDGGLLYHNNIKPCRDCPPTIFLSSPHTFSHAFLEAGWELPFESQQHEYNDEIANSSPDQPGFGYDITVTYVSERDTICLVPADVIRLPARQ